MGFFGFWARLPLWVRVPGGLLVAGLGAGILYVMHHEGGRRGMFVLGGLLVLAGAAMALNGPSDAEKKGYHDV